MSDLIERLRGIADMVESGSVSTRLVGDELRKAADEIERLRKEVKRHEDGVEQLRKDYNEIKGGEND